MSSREANYVVTSFLNDVWRLIEGEPCVSLCHCDWALMRVRAEDGSKVGAGAEDRNKTGAIRQKLGL